MSQAKFQLFLLMVMAIAIISGGYYWLTHRDASEAAARNLAAQNIEVTTANFLNEIKMGHLDNVRYFIQAGAQASLQDDTGKSALMMAVEAGDKDIVNLVVSALSANPQDAANTVNLQDSVLGNTALLIATAKNDKDTVSLLISKNADTSLTNKKLETPLLIAVKSKFSGLIPMLIAADEKQHHGASVNAEDASGETPLTYAIRTLDKATVDTLIVANADPIAADRSGVSPLMVAAQAGNDDIGDRLIEMGAKLDAADRFGNTPLTLAITHSHPDFARMLMDKGANPDFHPSGISSLQAVISTEPFDAQLFTLILERSKQNSSIDPSVLFDAIDHKNASSAKALVEHGVNATATNAVGETLLYHAIENGLEDVALELIDKGADINQTGVAGLTPLERAVRHNEVNVVGKLLAMGISPDQKTSAGYTLAEVAVYSGYPEVLDVLLAKGAKLEKDFGILWAIRDGKGKAVPVLLKYGAHPNVMSNSGDSALWLAASNGEVEAVAALIHYHAGLDYPNSAQAMTPLAIASNGGQLPVVKLLVEAGAKLDLADASGMTPLAHAAYRAKPEVVAYLLSKGADVHAADKQNRSISDLAALSESSNARDQVLSLLQKANRP